MPAQPVAELPDAELALGPAVVSGRKVAILQSNYIPWKGYFDLIDQVDEFILFDDAQFTKNDWRNRNRIKTYQGLKWLTIPVPVKGRCHRKIKDTVVSDSHWRSAHWKTITHNYARAKHFAAYRPFFEELYMGEDERRLSRINHRFITAICEMLSITTEISWSMDYQLAGGKTERLVELCRQAGATEYISGPAAKAYLDESLFTQEGMRVTWMDYSWYPSYTQLHPPFEHHVSIIDLILNEGADAAKFVRRSR
ncbi:MAG: WbqC family protein [Phycisphaerae bacterium]|nr:WbqC family protein [Phycisphaerae bacterium]